MYGTGSYTVTPWTRRSGTGVGTGLYLDELCRTTSESTLPDTTGVGRDSSVPLEGSWGPDL